MTHSPVHISTACTLPRLYDRPSRTACYKISAWPVVTQVSRSPTTVKQSRGGPRGSKRPGARLVPLERASCGIAMEVAKADSRTNWEALMNHINESIRDTQQQRMLGQYMIHKLKKEQTIANIPPEQAAANERCLESLIQRYGTGLEDVVSKEREFERLIEAYQVFMRGDKKKMQRKLERRQTSGRKLKSPAQGGEEPLPAIGDQKAGRSQVGCKIRHELRKEYGERVRMDFANRSAGAKKILHTQPGLAPKPMSVKVRKSVHSGQEQRLDTADRAFEEVDLPPTPETPKPTSTEEIRETDSQLSMTYVPSESQSLAQLIPDEASGITVEIQPEVETIKEEPPSIEEEATPIPEEKEEPASVVVEKEAQEDCLMLEGDSDPNVLIVNSQTELIPTPPSVTPKFEIVQTEEEKDQVAHEPTTDEKVEVASETKSEEVVKESEVDKEVTEVVQKLPEEEPEKVGKPETPGPVAAVEQESEAVSEGKDSAEPELERLVDEEDKVIYQVAAIDLVNGIFKNLDVEASDGEEKPDEKESTIKFKSSPEIVYYDKQTPENALACHPDDKLILSEDLSTAESELDEEAKALYHKVLSTAHSETEEPGVTPEVVAEKTPEVVAENTPEVVADKTCEMEAERAPEVAAEKTPEVAAEKTPEAEVVAEKTPEVAAEKTTEVVADKTEELTSIAKELTDTIIRNASTTPEAKEEEQRPSEVSEEDIAETAKLLTEAVIEKATTPVPTD